VALAWDPLVDWRNQRWYNRLERCAGARSPQWDTVRNCYTPDTQKGVVVCPGYARLPGAYGLYEGGYAYNGRGMWASGDGSCGLGLIAGQTAPAVQLATSPNCFLREGEVVVPSDMIAIGDAVIGCWGSPGPAGEIFFGWDLSPVDDSVLPVWAELGIFAWDSNCRKSVAGIKTRHGGRCNVVFCDGHVESLKMQGLFDARRDAVTKRWNRDNLPHREYVPNWH
jgi:prepilin-type processing-associated H-X9-DG protein